MLLADITARLIEEYLEARLRARRRIPTGFGFRFGDKLKPKTVHHEFAVLRRLLNVAVKKKKLAANPCDGVEFPASLTVGVAGRTSSRGKSNGASSSLPRRTCGMWSSS
jgi:hypothetical protein